MFGGRQCAHRPVPRPAPPVQPRTHRREDFHHVAHEIIGPLPRGSATTIRRPCADNAASRCSTPKRANRSRCSTTMTFASRSDKIRRSFGRLPFRPDLHHDLPHPQILAGRPRRQPGHLAIQISALIMAGHPRIDHHTTTRRVIADRRRAHQNQPTDPLRGHRQRPLPKPAISPPLAAIYVYWPSANALLAGVLGAAARSARVVCSRLTASGNAYSPTHWEADLMGIRGTQCAA